ncbi:MAG: hypothetical protein ABI895_23095 [Deltaproteobacteria bacterium]
MGSAPPPKAAAERTAVGIVESAISILDKQLATNGVGAVTTRPTGFSSPASSGTVLEFGEKYGRVHELLQELLRLLTAPGGSVPAGMLAAAPIPATAPVLQSRPAKAGETLTVPVPLANDSPNPANLILYSSDFVSDGGFEIPSLHVSFLPRTMTLAAHARNNTDMKIAIPAQSPAGLYSALVQASGLSAPQAVVVLKVE